MPDLLKETVDNSKELRSEQGVRTGNRRPRKPSLASTVLRWLPLHLALLAVIIMAGWMLSAPAYRALKRFRADSMVTQAEKMLEDNDTDGAWRTTMAAMAMAPDSPRVLRSVVQQLSPGGYVGAMEYWHQLEAISPLSLDEQLAFVEYCLRIRRMDIAEERMKVLLAQYPEEAKVHLLESHAHSLRQNLEMALHHAERALELGIGSKGDLLLGELLATGDEVQRIRGINILTGLILSNSDRAVQAAQVLQNVAALDPGSNDLIGRILERNTNSPIASILGFTFRMDAAAMEASQRLQNELNRFEPRDAAERYFLANWLITRNAPQLAINILPPESAKGNSEINILRFKALALAGDWPTLLNHLAETNIASDKVLAESFKGWHKSAIQRNDEASAHFNSAMEAAFTIGSRINRLGFVAQIAELAGRPDIAILAHHRHLQVPQFTVTAVREIFRLQGPNATLTEQFPIIKALNTYVPGDRNVAINYSYQALILRQDLSAATRIADSLIAQEPDNLDHRMIHVLATLQSGSPDKALELLEKFQINLESLSPTWQIVYANVLAKSQHRDAARNIARRINTTGLRPEELNFLNEAAGLR